MSDPTPIAVVARQLLERRGIDPDAPLVDDPDPADSVLDYATQVIPLRYRDAFATDPQVLAWAERIAADARAYAERHGKPATFVRAGKSLLILGPTGVGKTHQAYGAIRAIAAEEVRTGFVATTTANLYAALRPRPGVDSETEFARFARAPLLFVDDLGAAKTTEWNEEINYRLINHRYESEMATLFTSNVPPAELGKALGDRVSSRLVEMCERVVLKGSDRRRSS